MSCSIPCRGGLHCGAVFLMLALAAAQAHHPEERPFPRCAVPCRPLAHVHVHGGELNISAQL